MSPGAKVPVSPKNTGLNGKPLIIKQLTLRSPTTSKLNEIHSPTSKVDRISAVSQHALNALSSINKNDNQQHLQQAGSTSIQNISSPVSQKEGKKILINTNNNGQLVAALNKITQDFGGMSRRLASMEGVINSDHEALVNIAGTTGQMSGKIEMLEQKMDENCRVLGEVNTNVQGQGTAIGTCVKPPFVPFESKEDITNFQEATTAQTDMLKNYLLYYRGYETLNKCVLNIFQHDILMKESLLFKVNWAEASKNRPIVLKGTKLDHTLRNIFLEMYPTMTDKQYKTAVQNALKAAYNRINAKRLRKNKQRQQKRRGIQLDEDHYDKPYVAPERDIAKEATQMSVEGDEDAHAEESDGGGGDD